MCEEPIRDKHHPLMAALPFTDEDPMFARLQVSHSQTEDLTSAEATQQYGIDHGRLRCVRRAAANASMSTGDMTRGKVRGARTRGTPRTPGRPLDRLVARPRGTGLTVTPASIRTTRYLNRPETLESRRMIVRAAIPDSPSSSRTTFDPRLGARYS